MGPDSIFTVSQFVAVLNQILDTALPFVYIRGEVSNYQVRSNKWVSFKLKDAESIVECFGTVWQVRTPIEDGMEVQVAGRPQLSGKWGKFSVSVQSVTPTGQGGILRSLQLLHAKLEAEGLFEETRKRSLPAYPSRIGVVSSEAADGYKDFLRITRERWPLAEIILAPTQVQGDSAPETIVQALKTLNELPRLPDVIVVVRGGGSSEDLLAFSHEAVVRAVAASRAPTLVGVGHQADVCLSELAADVAAATPTHAAQLVAPDAREYAQRLMQTQQDLQRLVHTRVDEWHQLSRQFIGSSRRFTQWYRHYTQVSQESLRHAMTAVLTNARAQVAANERLLQQLSPQVVLMRGYALVRRQGRAVADGAKLSAGERIELQFRDGKRGAIIE